MKISNLKHAETHLLPSDKELALGIEVAWLEQQFGFWCLEGLGISK